MKNLLILLLTLLAGCKTQQNTKVSAPYEPTEADQPFANVFKSLDGKWQGTFYVYRDTLGQRAKSRAFSLNDSLFATLPLQEELTISVTQQYTSETPFLQKVHITDTYTDGQGRQQIVESEGENKVENGQLWCVVNKPDEQVVHTGSLPFSYTIIWQRDIKDPLKIEYFQETVLDSSYTILGWGYYGNDDPSLSPKTWFRGDYKRIP